MKDLTKKIYTTQGAIIISGILSLSALIFAYISQYVYGYQPCILCVYQRAPFWAIVMIALVASPLKNKKINTLGLTLITFSFAINAGISFFHSGVERKLWKGFEECATKLDSSALSLEELKNTLMQTPLARCDEIAWEIYGVSMANLNVLFCSALTIYCFTILTKPGKK